MAKLDGGTEAVRPIPPANESYVENLFRARYLEMVRLAGLLGADDPEDIAIIGLDVAPMATNANRAVGYFWIGYASPDDWFDQITPGPQFCNDTVDVTTGQSSGFCWPLPQLSPGHPASVTGDEQVGSGQMILQGAATAQVRSVTAVLPGGRSYPGVVKNGRGLPGNAWTVGYPPASGVRLVFRDASGTEVASLGTSAPQAVKVPTRTDYLGQRVTATAYDAAGHVIEQDTLGSLE
jgi:hypothetical protein